MIYTNIVGLSFNGRMRQYEGFKGILFNPISSNRKCTCPISSNFFYALPSNCQRMHLKVGVDMPSDLLQLARLGLDI